MPTLEYPAEELLRSHDYAAPLVAGGVVCHGGFTSEGTYVSPRTLHRVPAIAAWQDAHRARFGTEALALPIDTWPAHFPNVAQARCLLDAGVREPIVAILTRIGTVEGFGGLIRMTPVPAAKRTFDEDMAGTAYGHLTGGLYEAHARDEAGHGDEGGHRQMWFAARDVAFEHPVTEDETERMLARMGITGPGGAATGGRPRMLSDDIDPDLETLLERMIRLLFIEISAFHTFAWAEEVLGDTGRVAGDGEAARLVSYIRADETPHVDYLRTVLTEIRDREVHTTTGRRLPGTEVVGSVWDRALADSLGVRRFDAMNLVMSEVHHALHGRADAADVLARFHALGDWTPAADGTWVAA